jgi:hypothetical protein
VSDFPSYLLSSFRIHSYLEASRFKSLFHPEQSTWKMPLFAYVFSLCMQLHLQLPFLFNCSHKTLRDAEIALQVFPLFFFRLHFPSAINKCVHENWYFWMHESLCLMILWSRVSTINEHMEVHLNNRRREMLYCNHFLGVYASPTLYYRVSFYIGLVLRLFYAYFNSFSH